MIPDIDIWRSAKLMIREHSENAALEAALRVDAMLERGDMDGRVVRKRILRAVEELQRKVPEGGEQLN